MNAFTRQGTAYPVREEVPENFSATTDLPFFVDLMINGPRFAAHMEDAFAKKLAGLVDAGRNERSTLTAICRFSESVGGPQLLFARHHFEKRETAEDFAKCFGAQVREHVRQEKAA
jgi:hypothetical protein